jgi:hypothetical protein
MFNNNGQSGNVNTNEKWKALGFINIYLPTNSGGKKKLGVIPLRASVPHELEIFEALKACNGEEATQNGVNAVMALCQVDFNTAEIKEDNRIDLSSAFETVAATAVKADEPEATETAQSAG